MKAMRPVAPPGPAGRPDAITVAAFNALGSKTGTSSESIDSAGIFNSAVSTFIRRSFCISTAILTAARPVRLPLRVCRMKSLFFSMVNSKSCMSLKCFSSLDRTFSRSLKLLGISLASLLMAFGVRRPATTSSPCALIRYSP